MLYQIFLIVYEYLWKFHKNYQIIFPKSYKNLDKPHENCKEKNVLKGTDCKLFEGPTC